MSYTDTQIHRNDSLQKHSLPSCPLASLHIISIEYMTQGSRCILVSDRTMGFSLWFHDQDLVMSLGWSCRTQVKKSLYYTGRQFHSVWRQHEEAIAVFLKQGSFGLICLWNLNLTTLSARRTVWEARQIRPNVFFDWNF